MLYPLRHAARACITINSLTNIKLKNEAMHLCDTEMKIIFTIRIRLYFRKYTKTIGRVKGRLN
jgi:hypothetical protein